MAKLILSDISNGHKAPETINANNALIEAAVENTLSRDGTTPNQMDASLDMNGYSIINASNSTIAASDLANTVFVTTAADFKTQMESSSVKNVIVSSGITITSAVNGHANSNLIVYSGGQIDGAYALTIAGSIEAGGYQIFGSSITVSITGPNRSKIILDWFGTDETAFDSAVAATPNFGTMWMLSKAYNFSTGVTVGSNINVWMEGAGHINYSGTGTALTFTSVSQALMRLSVQRATTDWTDVGAAIEFNEVFYSKIHLDNVEDFQIGLYLNSTGSTGTFFNEFYLGRFTDCKHPIYLKGTTKFLNGNTFYGGYIISQAATEPTIPRYGVTIQDAGTNVFISPKIEMAGGASGGSAYYMNLIDNSKWNRIVEPYLEDQGNTVYAIQVTGAPRFNKITGHYSTASSALVSDAILENSGVTYPGTNTVDWATIDNVSLASGGLRTVFNLNNMLERAIASAVNPSYIVSGYTWLADNGVYVVARTDSDIYLSDTYLGVENQNALGRWIDTTNVKDFWFFIEHSGSADILIKAYDADLSLLSGGTHVTGIAQDTNTNVDFAQDASWGNGYSLAIGNGGTKKSGFFHVESTVKSIWIGVTATTATVNLTSFEVATNGHVPATNPGYELVSVGAYCNINTDKLYSDTKPIGGVFNNGTTIYDLNPTTGNAPGWNVTGRVTTAANGGEPAAETDVVVDSIAGVTSGDVMGVILTKDSNSRLQWHWTTVNGVPASSTLVMTHAVPTGFTIADGAKVITYRLLALPSLP